MDGFARRKEQSKEEIRRAAEELFSRFGADKVSINDIARKAGVSQATIYNNFGSKDELVHDYHNIIIKKIAGSFRGILLIKKTWADKFQSFLQSWLDIADQYKMEMDSTALNQPRNTIQMDIENLFREFIKEGKAQGNLRSDLSDEAIIIYIKFFQQGISGNPEIREKISRDSKLSRDLISLFVYGINGEKSAED